MTAAGGTSRGTPTRPLACPYWLGRRVRSWTPPRWPSSCVQTLLARAREKSEEEALAKEEEEKQEEETRLEIRSLLSVPSERRTAVQRSRLRALLQLRNEASSSSKRKRKKKRKKKLPKAAVRSSSGTSSSFVPAVRARDVFCARHVRDVPGCLSLFGAFAVFPSFVGRALLLGNMDGMDQDYSLTSSFLAVAYARLALLLFLAQCSCSLSSGPRCSTSWPVRIRSTVTCFSCARLVLLVILHFALCCLPCLLARDARHHGRYGPEGQLPRRVQNTVFYWEMFLCFRIQRNAWTSCYMLCVSLRMLLGRISHIFSMKVEPWRLHRCSSWTRLCHLQGRRHPCLYADADPHGPDCSENHRDSTFY